MTKRGSSGKKWAKQADSGDAALYPHGESRVGPEYQAVPPMWHPLPDTDVKVRFLHTGRSACEPLPGSWSTDADDHKWTQEERALFFAGFERVGEDFRALRKRFLPHLAVGDLVCFYFLSQGRGWQPLRGTPQAVWPKRTPASRSRKRTPFGARAPKWRRTPTRERVAAPSCAEEDSVVVDVLGDGGDAAEAKPADVLPPPFKRQRLDSSPPSTAVSAVTAADSTMRSFDAATSHAAAAEGCEHISAGATGARAGGNASSGPVSAASRPSYPAVTGHDPLILAAMAANDRRKQCTRRPCATAGCLLHEHHEGEHKVVPPRAKQSEAKVPRWLLALAQ